MNDTMAARSYQRHAQAIGAAGEQGRSSLRRDNEAYDWIKEKRSFREMVLFWRGFGYRLYSSLTKPRLPQGYYAFIENLNLKRGEALFLIVTVIVCGRLSFNVTSELISNIPEVDLFTTAQASEHLPITNMHTKEDLGEFLEDCYQD